MTERDSQFLVVIPRSSKKVTGQHNYSTWIMVTLTTEQDSPNATPATQDPP